MSVKRYCKDGYHAEHKDGPFVAFEDYAKLQARVEAPENTVRRMFHTREAYYMAFVAAITLVARSILLVSSAMDRRK